MLFGRVRASCPFCGEVEVRSTEVTVLARLEAMQNAYAFGCPTCSSWILKEADPSVVTLLLRSGAQVARSPQPLDGRAKPSLPPINHQDLMDFREMLEELPTAE